VFLIVKEQHGVRKSSDTHDLIETTPLGETPMGNLRVVRDFSSPVGRDILVLQRES
jgi:hypothetical protein